jgi:hypothetical protein
MKPLFLSITKNISNPQLLLPQTTKSILFTCTLLTLAATGSNLAVAQVDYRESDGIYMSMYGLGPDQRKFHRAINAALQLPYIKGIAYYQEWDELQPNSKTLYNWEKFDFAVKAAKFHKKKIILGLQAGVVSPKWVLKDSQVATFKFVHGNAGWIGWTTLTEDLPSPTELYKKGSVAPLPWNNKYNEHLNDALLAINKRIQDLTGVRTGANPTIAFINVCGPSVSGGTETNLNINWELSRTNYHDFDKTLGYTSEKYINAWKASINSHLRIFPNLKLGLGLHNKTGDHGINKNGDVIKYNNLETVATAKTIRDYFLAQHTESVRGKGHLRNLGLSANPNLWGDTGSMSADDFVTLVTEKSDSADIGYESGTVSRSNWESILGQTANPDQFSNLIEKGINHYGRILEIKVPDIISFDKYGNAYKYGPYVPVLEKAAKTMQPKTGSPKKRPS